MWKTETEDTRRPGCQIPKDQEDHEGQLLWSALDWLTDKDTHEIQIDPKYADDITFLRSSKPKMNKVKRIIPEMLQRGGLKENQSKREEYNIKDDQEERWQNCKCLGS